MTGYDPVGNEGNMNEEQHLKVALWHIKQCQQHLGEGISRDDYELRSQDLLLKGEVIPSNGYTETNTIAKAFLEEIEQYKNFIRNGVEYGYILVPENASDSAKDIIKKVLL